ncbi:MAG TPA: hydrogenase 3 maturation endopeptidase HyCI [Candidatus Krumholzibacteriaceae bacterium]
MPSLPKPLTPTLLRKTLQKTLSEADRIAVLGIGSDLRADDAAGVLVARQLMRSCAGAGSRCAAFEGGTAPENLTGEIIRFVRGHGTGERGHIVFVDTADMGLKPGSICLLERDDLAGVSFSTHQLPLSVLADYLQRSLPVEITFIAIQPRTVSFGGSRSSAGITAVGHVVSALLEAIAPPRRDARPAGPPVSRKRTALAGRVGRIRRQGMKGRGR